MLVNYGRKMFYNIGPRCQLSLLIALINDKVNSLIKQEPQQEESFQTETRLHHSKAVKQVKE
jgi:hypothetical protein